tara:strand:- start:1656 stop:2768 length:1113 start_codon:yes stop_codon:yes gene_type:complete
MTEETDLSYLQAALRLARHGMYSSMPNPRVGCLIVREEEIIGKGSHLRAGENHAEINALQDCKHEGSAKGATAYITLEPCCFHGRTPPCTDALIRAGLKRVVVAMEDPNPQVSGKGLDALRAAGILVDLIPIEEAVSINAGYISRIVHGKPKVIMKSAISLDGRIAMSSGESRWITGEESRRDVQELRARSCAIVTGTGTIINDNPRLTVRGEQFEVGGQIRQPLRVILDPSLRLSGDYEIFKNPKEALIVHCDKMSVAKVAGVEHKQISSVLDIEKEGGQVDLEKLLTWLGDRGCNNILVEAGSKVFGSFIASNLWDEIILYIAPKILGKRSMPLADWSINRMAETVKGNIVEHKAIGSDLCVRISRET